MTASTSRDRQAHWDDRYRTVAPDQVSWYEAEPRRSLDLIDRVGVAPTTPVIDVGGGASAFAGELIRRGFVDVTVLDVSEEALHVARSRSGRPESIDWVHADLLDWTPSRRWGLWHDRALFHFLTEAGQREAYRRLLREAVAPGGVVLITTFAAGGPRSCSGLPVQRYDVPELLVEIGPGFTEIAHGRFVHTTPSGAGQHMTWVAVRAPADVPASEVAVRSRCPPAVRW